MGQRLRAYAEQVTRRERRGLCDEVGDQVASPDRREATDVEDLLLRVQRADLPARLGKRVDDGDAQAPEAGVIGGEQPGRPGTDDGDVHLDHAAIAAFRR
nr:hypothetical protein GCM10020092_064690 [Actinoplanes digitatis]